MPYRLIYICLGLTAIAAIALGIAFSTEGEAIDLHRPLESVSPEPGDLVPPQTILEIDLEVGYDAEIFVDGWPLADVTFVEGTGVYRWAPSASNPNVQEWTPGKHTVRVVWDAYSGLPDPGSFEWSFRIG